MQKLLTKDSLAITVDAVVYIHVLDASKSVMNVRDAARSTMMLAQTTLRNVLGTKDLLEILAHRDEIGAGSRTRVWICGFVCLCWGSRLHVNTGMGVEVRTVGHGLAPMRMKSCPGKEIRVIVDDATDPWGICVERVELTDLLRT